MFVRKIFINNCDLIKKNSFIYYFYYSWSPRRDRGQGQTGCKQSIIRSLQVQDNLRVLYRHLINYHIVNSVQINHCVQHTAIRSVNCTLRRTFQWLGSGRVMASNISISSISCKSSSCLWPPSAEGSRVARMCPSKILWLTSFLLRVFKCRTVKWNADVSLSRVCECKY